MHVSLFMIERFLAPAPKCLGARPVCTTCLYASNAQRCIAEGYEEDCSAMNDVSPFHKHVRISFT